MSFNEVCGRAISTIHSGYVALNKDFKENPNLRLKCCRILAVAVFIAGYILGSCLHSNIPLIIGTVLYYGLMAKGFGIDITKTIKEIISSTSPITYPRQSLLTNIDQEVENEYARRASKEPSAPPEDA